MTHGEAIALGARPDDLACDLKKGYRQIFSDSLRVDPGADTALQDDDDTPAPVTALLQEFASSPACD